MHRLRAILKSIRKAAQTPVGPLLREAILVLLQTFVHIILPAILAGILYVGSFLGPVTSRRIWPFLRPRLVRFTDGEADPFLLGLFRISLGAIGLWYAVVTFGYIEFTWYSHTAEFRDTVRLIHIAWVALAALFLVGLGGRLTTIAHFIVICWILNCDDIDGTVNDDLYLIASFWAMFMRLDGALALRRFLPVKLGGGSMTAAPRVWPILLLGVNDGIFFLTAGLTKFYDPFWIQGIGLYETLSLPWIKDPAATFLLNHKALLATFNYLALAFELLFLPLFIVRRTRWIACALMLLFYLQLTYPVRIDLIGPFGMAHTIALTAVTPIVVRGVRKLRGLSTPSDADDPFAVPALQPPADSFSPNDPSSENRFRDDLRCLWMQICEPRSLVRCACRRFVALFFAAYVALHGMWAVLNVRFDPHYLYPPVPRDAAAPTAHDSATGPTQPPISNAEFWKLRFRSRVEWINDTFFYPHLVRLNDAATKILPKTLFSASHFFGNYEYRVVVTLRDGSTREPFVVFHEDKTPGPFSAGFGCPRYFQRCMYEVSGVCVSRVRAPDVPVTNPKYVHIMNDLLNFATLQLPQPEREQVAKVELLASPMVVPNKFEGDSRPWLEYPWTAIYEHDIAKNEYRFTGIPAPYPYKLLPYYP